ncbi:MAG: hypothetical protein IJX67_10485 [Oscillospiraceae bacterium]|nr:hypothetical protein [Oscillospiraceae bacterium]MBQ9168815.1 hypothetical protein [Oscillospiraceae bacterium]
MGKIKPKHLPEYYREVARSLQEAFLKLGMRSRMGYIQTAEERKALLEIQEVFFPGQEPAEELSRAVLIKAHQILTDASSGISVAYLPSVSRLRIANHAAKQLRDLPLHFYTGRSELK